MATEFLLFPIILLEFHLCTSESTQRSVCTHGENGVKILVAFRSTSSYFIVAYFLVLYRLQSHFVVAYFIVLYQLHRTLLYCIVFHSKL